MIATALLLLLAVILWLAFARRKTASRDQAAEAARKAVEARLEGGAAPQQDEDSRA
jgi:hypothetical protein